MNTDYLFPIALVSIVAMSSCIDDTHAMAAYASHSGMHHGSTYFSGKPPAFQPKQQQALPFEYRVKYGVIPQFPVLVTDSCDKKGTKCK